MAAQAQKEEVMDIPEGGIANFVMSDKEAEDAYGPDTEVDDTDGTEEFGDDGIAQFPALTKKMAAMGREGDDNLAHVQTGELIIPAKLIENDDELKELLFEKLREMGIEDPERYVVGSDENSIHPETGAYEFFFKKLFKGIKKVFKKIVNVVKKVAPLVLSIGLAATPLGAIYGAALGSGIGTLIQGGSLSDALKAGVMAGVTGGVIKGFQGPGSFMQNVGAELAGGGARLAQTGAGFMNTVKGEGFRGAGNLFQAFDPAAAQAAGKLSPGAIEKFSALPKTLSPEAATELAKESAFADAEAAKAGTFEVKGVGESILDGDAKSLFAPGSTAPNATQIQAAFPNMSAEAAATAAANAAPSLLRSYGPAAVAGTALAAAAGGFTAAEQEDPGLIDKDEDGNAITGSDLIAADPGKYLVKDLGQVVLNEETGEYETKSMYQPSQMSDYSAMDTQMVTRNPFESGIGSVSTATGPFARPSIVQNVAQGGQIFPRRNGGIMPDEGVAGKDSVRAMLMPGEFVMTTDAVKGMGNGNMDQGINNMYSVMRNLESRGRQTA